MLVHVIFFMNTNIVIFLNIHIPGHDHKLPYNDYNKHRKVISKIWLRHSLVSKRSFLCVALAFPIVVIAQFFKNCKSRQE